MPTICIEPLADLTALDAALQVLADYDWLIFTHANAVAIVGERLRAAGLTPKDLDYLQIAACGRAGNHRCLTYLWPDADFCAGTL